MLNWKSSHDDYVQMLYPLETDVTLLSFVYDSTDQQYINVSLTSFYTCFGFVIVAKPLILWTGLHYISHCLQISDSLPLFSASYSGIIFRTDMSWNYCCHPYTALVVGTHNSLSSTGISGAQPLFTKRQVTQHQISRNSEITNQRELGSKLRNCSAIWQVRDVRKRKDYLYLQQKLGR